MQLAQVNVARLLHPIDAPETAAFVAALDPINALADRAPGFVWRLQEADGNATSIRIGDDDLLIVNLSVWESLAALRQFVFAGDHLGILRRRLEWFERGQGPRAALWWVPDGTRPTVEEATRRLDRLRAGGPSAEAFDFAHPSGPDGA